MIFTTHARLAGWMRELSRVGAGIVIAVGVSVLVGWGFRIEPLKRIFPDLIAMNPMTAVCFILSGTALLLLHPLQPTIVQKRSAEILAFLVLLVSIFKLIDYAFFIETGIDKLVFRYRIERELIPNRIAPNTAVAMALISVSMLTMDFQTKWVRRPSQVFVIICGMLCWLAILGYAYSVATLYGVTTYIPMALHTALAFLVLSVSMLFLRPNEGFMAVVTSDTTAGIVVRRLIPTAILLPSIVGWFRLIFERVDYFSTETGTAFSVITNISIFLALVWWNAALLYRSDLRRNRAEAALGDERNLLSTLINSLPDLIFVKDLQGRNILNNKAHQEFLAHTADELRGKTVYDYYPKELADVFAKDEQEVMHSGKTLLNREERSRDAQGNAAWVSTTKVPYGDGHGNIIGLIGISRDITSRKQAEEELQEKNLLLEHLVASEREAMDALKQAQSTMVQTEKLAGLGQMVAGVAHEINNPLSFVSNNVAVLTRDLAAIKRLLELYQQAEPTLEQAKPELFDEIKEFCEEIDLPYTMTNLDELLKRSKEGLRRIQQIVKDLRDFARLDESDLHEIDLNAGIESTVNIIRGKAKGKRVELQTDLHPLPPITCFPAKLNQVIMNLISNAIDACDEGGQVKVESHANGDRIHVIVSDNGSGIPPEVRQRIFDPFFTTKPPGQGTGLGLSISYGIIQDHQGSITVDSEPGHGSRFEITVPTKPVLKRNS
jgi:PAS domain S-box-containing protein